MGNLAMQLRAIAARAPILDRPAIAAAADAVEELSKLRAELDEAKRHLAAVESDYMRCDARLFSAAGGAPGRPTRGGAAMKDMFATAPIPIAAQIACVEREIAMRLRVYPRWVAVGKMTQAKADSEIAAMTVVRESLNTVAAAEGAQ